jgi:hypothetical protein
VIGFGLTVMIGMLIVGWSAHVARERGRSEIVWGSRPSPEAPVSSPGFTLFAKVLARGLQSGATGPPRDRTRRSQASAGLDLRSRELSGKEKKEERV